MQNESVYAIGLMSGTSLDGLDIAYCRFSYKEGLWDYDIIEATTIEYPPQLKLSLKNSMMVGSEGLISLDHELGIWMGSQVQEFINERNFKADLIASHGHTVFHQPEKGFTFQIGNANCIYHATNVPVISNFRQLDVIKGGQGAPLVPIGDHLLFSAHDYCLNLGGIANFSFKNNQGQRIANDICFCNIVLNHLAAELNYAYDDGGHLAAKGAVDLKMLDTLNDIPYYIQTGPKSLGKEMIDQVVIPIIEGFDISIEDKLATVVRHIAQQIVRAMDATEVKNVLITGGGAYNKTLIKELMRQSDGMLDIIQADQQLIDFKEAMVFAFLGALKIRGQVNVLKTVTGASSDSIAGDCIGMKCI